MELEVLVSCIKVAQPLHDDGSHLKVQHDEGSNEGFKTI